MPQRSFIEVSPESHFPIQNLPYGIFRTTKRGPRPGVAIGEFILDLRELQIRGFLRNLPGIPEDTFQGMYLNSFMKLGRPVWKRVRERLQELLDADNPTLRDNSDLRTDLLVPMSRATMLLPAKIGDYTDFYASLHHAQNVGTLFRGAENALNPNWKHLPVGYHGRASTVFVGGGPVKRPMGQIIDNASSVPGGSPTPILSHTRKLDFELETAFLVGPPVPHGQPLSIMNAEDHIFGVLLMNDWSARDIQQWEYVPLGPFLGKSFHTSISPWVVTLEALEPFRCASPEQSPPPLDYLRHAKTSSYDANLEVKLGASGGDNSTLVTISNMKYLYWSMAQQLTHHTINGCLMRTGDLLGSGTISGPEAGSLGCLLEITKNGTTPVHLNDGTIRTYLENGDTVCLSGYCEGEGFRVGFGEFCDVVVG